MIDCAFNWLGIPWTEEEHKLFLLGLEKVGKGDWRGISRNFVKTRTPTQVASHAQKYFIRKSNLNRRGRRRSSLFDITTDSVFSRSSPIHFLILNLRFRFLIILFILMYFKRLLLIKRMMNKSAKTKMEPLNLHLHNNNHLM